MIEPLVPEEVSIQALGWNCLLFTGVTSVQGLELEEGFDELLRISSLTVCN
jgi:hypothetical protein